MCEEWEDEDTNYAFTRNQSLSAIGWKKKHIHIHSHRGKEEEEEEEEQRNRNQYLYNHLKVWGIEEGGEQ